MKRYQSLFRHLNAFRFLYIAPRLAAFSREEKRFRSYVQAPLESDVSSELLRYFTVRRKWERHEYVVPHTDDFEFLAEARQRFHGQRFEDLYAATRTKEDIACIRHVYIDLDYGGRKALEGINSSNLVPTPNFILNSSPEKFQIVWKVEAVKLDEAEALLHALARESTSHVTTIL